MANFPIQMLNFGHQYTFCNIDDSRYQYFWPIYRYTDSWYDYRCNTTDFPPRVNTASDKHWGEKARSGAWMEGVLKTDMFSYYNQCANLFPFTIHRPRNRQWLNPWSTRNDNQSIRVFIRVDAVAMHTKQTIK